MPPSVITAVAIVIGFIGLNILSGERSGRIPIMPIAIQGLIIVGLVLRDRLAWQWGRLVPLLFAILTVVIVLTSGRNVPIAFIAVPLLLFVPAVAVVVSLGRPSARAWFRLDCPACGGNATKAADFLFRRARCRTCGNEW